MSGHNFMPDNVSRYITGIAGETSVQQRLRKATMDLPESMMLTTPDQTAFLAFLVKVLNARLVLEIGTFTGYSTLAMAAALPEDGKLIACDVSRKWTDIGRPYWKEAQVDQRIDLRIAPALETLKKLAREKMFFDMAFIDADKTGYDGYYEACLTLLRPGGVIAFDNMLWGGAVADKAANDPDTKALRALNLKIRDDKRVDSCLLTVADGIVLVRKK